jgi:hypothetical protein
MKMLLLLLTVQLHQLLFISRYTRLAAAKVPNCQLVLLLQLQQEAAPAQSKQMQQKVHLPQRQS